MKRREFSDNPPYIGGLSYRGDEGEVMSEVKKTALSDNHAARGAKMVDFAGWWMPVQFEGLKQEHHRVRNQVGLFDVSHMGEIRVKGPKALEALQWLTSNDVSQLHKGKAQYTLLTNFQGGIVDDLIVYCIEPEADSSGRSGRGRGSVI